MTRRLDEIGGYGSGGRAQGGPIGTVGRAAKPRRYIPLSQFFMNRDTEMENPSDSSVMGFQTKADAKRLADDGKAPKVPLKKPEKAKTKPKAPEKAKAGPEGTDEGMTGTANVGVTPVPLGYTLDYAPGHPKHRGKKKRKKKMAHGIGAMLRRHNPVA